MAVRPGRAEAMLLEETVGPRTRDKTDAEKRFRKVLRGQVQALKDAGVQIEIPAEVELEDPET
ncbi:MAG: hypothetical protein V3R89_01585 [Thermoanaerobaculia bacterium]